MSAAKTFPLAGAGALGLAAGDGLGLDMGTRVFWEGLAVILHMAQQGLESPPKKIHFPEGTDRQDLSQDELGGLHEIPSFGGPLAGVDRRLQNRMAHVVLLVILFPDQEPALAGGFLPKGRARISDDDGGLHAISRPHLRSEEHTSEL